MCLKKKPLNSEQPAASSEQKKQNRETRQRSLSSILSPVRSLITRRRGEAEARRREFFHALLRLRASSFPARTKIFRLKSVRGMTILCLLSELETASVSSGVSGWTRTRGWAKGRGISGMNDDPRPVSPAGLELVILRNLFRLTNQTSSDCRIGSYFL